MRAARIRILMVGCLAVIFIALPGVALAYDETTSTIPSAMNAANCGGCHDPWSDAAIGTGVNKRIGVHGGYTVTTSKCEECHSVHAAPAAGVLLLPAATIKATCFTCHDGTAGRGVYGAIAARGMSVGSSHSVETTNVVPGGNATTGGSAAVTFAGPGGTLTCTSCHAPHGSNMVTAFPGERQRSATWGILSLQTSSRLLKQRPGNATTATAVYGSDWCLGCHKGRDSGLSTVHNHPVESATTYANAATRFNYGNVARLSAGAGASTTPTGALAQSNGGYLMPFPRTAQQTGHLPICQQCHEDTRAVGTLSSTGASGTVTPFIQSGVDGAQVGDNPRFQNFPHETTGYRMLVEAGTTSYTDDLCLNCHPSAQLP